MVVPAYSSDAHSEKSLTFERAFEAILVFTQAIHLIERAEISVTKVFAGPFSQGGLLVLLERPLATHPWEGGASEVISDCPTLELLQQGLRLASNGLIRFLEDVSVLDRWPMHDQARLSKLTPNMCSELDRLALEAIIAKRPDVILCMGEVSVPFLNSNLEKS